MIQGLYTEPPVLDLPEAIASASGATESVAGQLLFDAAESCGVFGSLAGLVDEAAAAASAAAEKAVTAVVEAVGAATKKIKEIASRVGAALSGINAKIVDFFNSGDEGGLTSFLGQAKSVLDSITSAIGAAVSKIAEIGTKIAGAVASVVGVLTGAVQELNVLACTGTKQALTALGTGVSSAFDSLAGPLQEGKSPDDIIKEKTSGPATVASDAAKNAAETASSDAGAITDSLSNGVSDQVAALENFVV